MKKNLFMSAFTIMFMLTNLNIYAQGGNLGNAPLGNPNDILGWDGLAGTAQHLKVENLFTPGVSPYNINFLTNASQKMTILGTAGSDDGYVGIGIATPNRLLQVNDPVNGGVIDLTGPGTSPDGSSYQINGDPVLWHNGNIVDIFVGVSAGNNSMTGHENTYVGYAAGNATNSAGFNTFVGYEAGRANTSGNANTFIGAQSGLVNTTAGQNTFIGHGTGISNTIGSSNTFVGNAAGFDNVDGDDNSFLGQGSGNSNTSGLKNSFFGRLSGSKNTDGYENTFIGYGSGYNADATINNSNSFLGGYSGFYFTTGALNTFIGHNSGVPSPTGTITVNNSTALGANATVLTDNTMILGNYDISVGIGLSGVSGGPLAKLHVQRNLGAAAPVSTPTSIYSFNNDEDAAGTFSGPAYGIISNVTGQNTLNYAGKFNAENAAINLAGYFTTTGTYTGGPDNALNYAGLFKAYNGNSNIGVLSAASGGTAARGGYFSGNNGSGFNIGVEGYAAPTATSVFDVAIYGTCLPALPLGSPPPPLTTGSFAGYFNGDVGYTSNLWFLSDSTIKTAIHPLQNTDSILNLINTYSYYFDSTQLQGLAAVPHTLQYGFMAQQLESVAPNLVLNTIIPPALDSAGNVLIPARPVKMFNPIGIIPLLVAANKSLSSKDSALEERVSQLEQIVNTCCNGNHRSTGSPTQEQGSDESGDQHSTGSNDFPIKQTIDLASSNPILYQNHPNPFDNNTTIRYFIPENANQPKIIFEDETGRSINEIVITEKGQGAIQVNSQLLNSGVYTYSLQIGGKIIDSKKMMKAK